MEEVKTFYSIPFRKIVKARPKDNSYLSLNEDSDYKYNALYTYEIIEPLEVKNIWKSMGSDALYEIDPEAKEEDKKDIEDGKIPSQCIRNHFKNVSMNNPNELNTMIGHISRLECYNKKGINYILSDLLNEKTIEKDDTILNNITNAEKIICEYLEKKSCMSTGPKGSIRMNVNDDHKAWNS